MKLPQWLVNIHLLYRFVMVDKTRISVYVVDHTKVPYPFCAGSFEYVEPEGVRGLFISDEWLTDEVGMRRVLEHEARCVVLKTKTCIELTKAELVGLEGSYLQEYIQKRICFYSSLLEAEPNHPLSKQINESLTFFRAQIVQ